MRCATNPMKNPTKRDTSTGSTKLNQTLRHPLEACPMSPTSPPAIGPKRTAINAKKAIAVSTFVFGTPVGMVTKRPRTK